MVGHGYGRAGQQHDAAHPQGGVHARREARRGSAFDDVLQGGAVDAGRQLADARSRPSLTAVMMPPVSAGGRCRTRTAASVWSVMGRVTRLPSTAMPNTLPT